MKLFTRTQLSIFAATVCMGAIAQQDKLSTHFIYDKMSLNPGETGIENGTSAALIHRNQFNRLNGSPSTFIFNAETNINKIPGGIGLSLYQNEVGFINHKSAMLNYSYPIEMKDGVLGIGVGVGLFDLSNDPDWIPPTNAPTTFPDNWGNRVKGLDLNFGFYYQSNKNYYLGLSAIHVNAEQSRMLLEEKNMLLWEQGFMSRVYNVMGGYKLNDVGPGTASANVLLRTNFTNTLADVNLMYEIKGKIFAYNAGVTYRTNNTVPFIAGISYKYFTLGYAYELRQKIPGWTNNNELVLRFRSNI